MFRLFRNSKYTTSVALTALLVSLFTAGFLIADAYSAKENVLAKSLQALGLCGLPDAEAAETSTGTGVTAGADGSAGGEGAAGSDGASGLDGSSGSDGADGSAGSDGSNGVDGTAGANGTDGAAGSNGADGATGSTGATGANGSDGSTGATGSTGPAGSNGICDISSILPVAGDLLPSIDNTYSLGSTSARWKSLQLGPGTLWIQDSEVSPPTQVGLTVKSGALLLDGADSLRIGNIRLTATGLTSILPTSPITLGDATFTNYVELQAGGIKFKDGTIQSTASTGGATGPAGPAGPRGVTGAQGPQGDPGSMEGYVDVPVCIDQEKGQNENGIFYGSCEKLGLKGIDIVMLQKK